jgi:solute:Na+ symporter, SSS family
LDPFATRIDTLDLAVIGACFPIVFMIGADLARRTHSADDLYPRRTPAWLAADRNLTVRITSVGLLVLTAALIIGFR